MPAAAKAVLLRRETRIVTIVPGTACPEVGRSFAERVETEYDVARFQLEVWNGLGDQYPVRLADDLDTCDNRYILSGFQGGSLNAVVLPRRVHRRMTADFPVLNDATLARTGAVVGYRKLGLRRTRSR